MFSSNSLPVVSPFSLLFANFEEENCILPGSNGKWALSTMSPLLAKRRIFSKTPFAHFPPMEMALLIQLVNLERIAGSNSVPLSCHLELPSWEREGANLKVVHWFISPKALSPQDFKLNLDLIIT